jgi:hypothetical protein
MSHTKGKISTLDAVSKYTNVCLDKVSIAFGDTLSRPKNGFIPYKANNTILTNQIENYFSLNNKWKSIDLNDLRDNFSDEYWSIFHYIGWQGTYYLTPLLIKLAYEGYFVRDEICSTVENIFSRFPRESDDKSMSFLDWMTMYDKYQIICVLDMMTLFEHDPLHLYPDGFVEGRRWWTRYYVDGPSL